MIPASFEYVEASSADAAIAALAEHGDEAKLLAGGHSLIPLMRFRLATPGVLVDIGRLDDLSYINDGGDHVAIGALTRHRATGDRRGAILINPGGPGGDGLSTAWGVRGNLSSEILRSFDIVAWDPRGVGQSTPKIDCDDDTPPGSFDFIARCVELTGPLSGYLSAPYSAADMEAIRTALGEDELNYLGFSYGAILGATFAATHPERVGAFVLDGVTDPLTGGPDGPFADGFPTLADNGFDAAIDRFAEICNATERCLFSLDAAAVLDDLRIQERVLPTPDFAGQPDIVDSDGFDDLIDDSITYAGEWELLATALEDADRGDASALASLVGGPPGAEGSSGEEHHRARATSPRLTS